MSTRVDFTTPAFKVVRELDVPRPYYWVERPEAVVVDAKSIIGILGFLKSPGLHGRKMVI